MNSAETPRAKVDRQISSRLTRSSWLQRTLLGVAVTAGLFAGPSEGIGESKTSNIAWITTWAALVSGVSERIFAIRRCRGFVGDYARNAWGYDEFFNPVFPPVLGVEEGKVVEGGITYDSKASELNASGGIAEQAVIRGTSTVSAFMGSYLIARAASGEITPGFEPIIYTMGGSMVAAAAGMEIIATSSQRRMLEAYGRQLDNIDRGPSFELPA